MDKAAELQLRFDPWPGNFRMLQVHLIKEKKKIWVALQNSTTISFQINLKTSRPLRKNSIITLEKEKSKMQISGTLIFPKVKGVPLKHQVSQDTPGTIALMNRKF